MFKPYAQNQGQLLPPNFSDMIEKDHTARIISSVVDEMDISAIEQAYSSQGCRAYHPAREYFKKKISEGKSKSQALVCLRRHMVTLVWSMMKHKTK